MSGDDLKVFLNEKLVCRPEANVNVDTVAFKYGAMVFEGIRAYWSEREQQLFVFRLEDHARRLEDSTRVMRFDTKLNRADFCRAVLQLLEANQIRQHAHIRQMLYVDGPGEMFQTGPVSHAITVTPKAGWFSGKEEGIHSCVSSWQRITDNSMPPRVKCAANYQNGRLALLQARLDGYDSAILLNASGKVAEEARGCIFVVKSGQIATPRVTNDILESITRATLIRLFRDLHNVEVMERDLDRTELYLAEEVFICGSGLEVAPVLSVDRHPINGGRPGEMTLAIRESYLKAARGEDTRYRDWITPVYAPAAA
jgi:branched-chain amino acid aminotransferase